MPSSPGRTGSQGCPRALFFQALLLPSRAVHMQITLLRSSESCRSAEIPHAKRGHSHPPGASWVPAPGTFPQDEGPSPGTFPTVTLGFAQALRPHGSCACAVWVLQLALLLSLLHLCGCHRPYTFKHESRNPVGSQNSAKSPRTCPGPRVSQPLQSPGDAAQPGWLRLGSRVRPRAESGGNHRRTALHH